MFETSEQLLEFVDKADEVLMDQVFEGAVSDLCLYEDENVLKALDKYVEMLEADEVDEKFEEHLSTILVPYFATTATFYDGVMAIDEAGKIQMAKAMTKAWAKGKAGKLKTDASIMKKKLGEKVSSAKEGLGKKVAAAKEGIANKAFDAKFKARGFMKSMRHKYGAKALANKIKRGYQGAVKWAKESALGKKVQGAYAAGMAKKAKKLAGQAAAAGEKAKKLATT